MGSTSRRGHRWPSGRVVLSICSVLALSVSAAATGSAVAAPMGGTSVVYSFAGAGDGEYPSTDLIVDSAGNLYGTSVSGGDFGSGTVFELSPSGAGWTHTVLYSFKSGTDGAQPYGGVVADPHGDLYGTAVVGGTGGSCVESGCGVVFKLTHAGGKWRERVIYNFTGGIDGYGPGGGLTRDNNGRLYGMTPTGGAHGLGVIFQLRPGGGANWTLSVIHAFTGRNDGSTGSAGRLLLDGSGGIYGVATVGGAHGSGAAFHVARDQAGNWKLTPIYEFKGTPDAGFPYGGLITDGSGNFYGTTYYDGANNLGSVYQLARTPSGGWNERLLYSFAGGADGSYSISTLVRNAAGDLYGTTSEGGVAGFGTIFKLAPSSGGQWTESVAYSFPGAPGAAFAYNGMAADSTGNLYGTTVHGGATNDGAIYRFTP